MSKKTETAEAKKPGSHSRPPAGPGLLGSDILVACLEREGVDTIFAYPGGASLELHQALTRCKKIRTVLPRHEQGGVFAAEGYARATGKVGVCMATSGPGATNLVTGIADASADSIPLIAITGQVPYALIGKNAFQETDFFGMTLPIVKHSYLVTDANDIPQIFKEAFYVARSGRPGPVVIDVPKNVQQQRTHPVYPDEAHLRGYAPQPEPDPAVWDEIIRWVAQAERPVLYVGGGIISGEASQELLQFAEATQIPVATTLMGCGAFPENHVLSLKWLGMHGTAYANWAVGRADLLLAFGVRFDDRVTGNVRAFCEHGTIVHVDIDPSEINKNKPAQLGVVGDVRLAFQQLNRRLAAQPLTRKLTAWHQQIADWKKQAPLQYHVTSDVLKSRHLQELVRGDLSQVILPQHVVETLWELTGGDALIVTGVGQHQMWAGQFYRFSWPRQFLTSGGLGSMGFGWPAALGAKVARPDKQVVDIDGDGSFLMNIQELATAHIERIAAKAIILNNQHLGMVVQWEDRFYQGNRGNTFLGDPRHKHQIYPDFVAIAHGFQVAAERVVFKKDLRPALQRMLDAREAYVLDVMTPDTAHVLPFIKAGGTVADMIYE